MFKNINKAYLIPLILYILSLLLIVIIFKGNFQNPDLIKYYVVLSNLAIIILQITSIKINWFKTGFWSKFFSIFVLMFILSSLFDILK